MRRPTIIALWVALAVVVGLSVWAVARRDPSAVDDARSAATDAALPEFQAVDLRSSGTGGLTLSGVVRNPAGRPVSGATVSIAASGQSSLGSLRCTVCDEPLLACRARTSTTLVEAFMTEHRGELKAGATARTNERGQFQFEALAGISFTVWASAPGLGTGVKERAAPGDPVELFLPALRSIAGRLRNEEGQAVAGRVFALSRRLAKLAEAAADAQGRFELLELGEGPFYVLASAPGLMPASADMVEAGAEPLTLTLMSPRALEVRLLSQGKPVEGTVRVSGDHLALEYETTGGAAVRSGFPAARVLVSAFVGDLSSAAQAVSLDSKLTSVTLTLDRGGFVAVLVLDEAEQPVPGPLVELVDLAGEVVFKKRLGTGELGVLGPVVTGDYQLRASAEQYAAASLPVAVRLGETRVDITLSRGVSIAGRVIDEYGRPAPGVSVLVTPTGESFVSNQEGRFRAPVPSPGLYSLHAHHSDWGGGSLKVQAPKEAVELQLEPRAGAAVTVSVEGRRVEGASVMLFHSQGNFRSDRPSGADGVVLMRGLPVDSYTLVATHPDFLPSERQPLKLEEGQLLQVSAELRAGAAVKGQVVDTQGIPQPNVQVGVQPRGAELVSTDATGRFEIAPLRPKGVYAVMVLERGFEQNDRVVASAGGDPVKVVVQRLPTFRGRVLGEGQPLRQFRVDDHDVNTPDGRFELTLPASNDRVIVSVEAAGFEPTVVDRPRSPELGDFDLRRAPAVTGVVKEATGAIVADAVVGCDSCERSVLSGPDGRFSLSKPPYQREFNLVAKKGRRTAVKNVSADATIGLELVLRPGVQVSGIAYQAPGKPAAGVEIAGINAERSENTTVVTNEDGSYQLEIPPGTYSFMLALPEYQSVAADPPALITEVKGDAMRLDFGPVPGTSSLSVRLTPKPGFALWLVRGELGAVGNPPLELLRAPWAQLLFQPRVPTATFYGLAPGRYTLVWASFHGGVDEVPALLSVQVPAQPEVSLVR